MPLRGVHLKLVKWQFLLSCEWEQTVRCKVCREKDKEYISNNIRYSFVKALDDKKANEACCVSHEAFSRFIHYLSKYKMQLFELNVRLLGSRIATANT